MGWSKRHHTLTLSLLYSEASKTRFLRPLVNSRLKRSFRQANESGPDRSKISMEGCYIRSWKLVFAAVAAAAQRNFSGLQSLVVQTEKVPDRVNVRLLRESFADKSQSIFAHPR